MAKVVHLTSVHIPFDTRIFHKECRTLREAGHEVVLVASHDRSEVVEGITVKGVRPRSRRGRMLRTTVDIYRLARAEGADVYHFHDPEFLPVGWLLARRGNRVIWDTHEDVTRQLLTKEWLPPRLRRPASITAGAIERWCSDRCAAVISAEPTGAPRFRHPRVVVIQNWPRLDEIPPAGPGYSTRPPHIVYVGSITEARGLAEMIAAVNLLPEALGVRLKLAGTFGPPDLEADVGRRDIHSRVSVLGQLPRDAVKDLLGSARLGLVVLHSTPQFVDSQPVKLFEYMAAGIPFVASDFPVWRELGGEKAGLYVDPLDPEALAEAVSWLIGHPEDAAQMGREGRNRVESEFSWEAEGKRLVQLYDEVLGEIPDARLRGPSTGRVRRIAARAGQRMRTAVRSPRAAMSVLRRDIRGALPGVRHAGFRSAGRYRRIESTEVFEKTYTYGAENSEALANEVLARTVFASAPWLVPIVRAEDRTIALPRLRDDLRLDRVAGDLRREVRRDIARQALHVAFDIYQQGYAHRDFRAQNMFWDRGQLRLIDFEGLGIYPPKSRPPFPKSYDLIGEGLESPFNTKFACYASDHPKSLEVVLAIPLEEALDLFVADLRAEGKAASRTFKRGTGRHQCTTEAIYASFDIPHFRVGPEEAQRSSADRFLEFGVGADGLVGQSVLDLGSNTGGMLFEAWSRGATRGLGVEYDADKVRWAEKVAAFAGIDEAVRFSQADIDSLVGDEIGAFDVVFCLAIERHVRSREALLALLARVCTRQLLFEGNSSTDIAWVESTLLSRGFASVRRLGPSRADAVERNRHRELLVASKTGDGGATAAGR